MLLNKLKSIPPLSTDNSKIEDCLHVTILRNHGTHRDTHAEAEAAHGIMCQRNTTKDHDTHFQTKGAETNTGRTEKEEPEKESKEILGLYKML